MKKKIMIGALSAFISLGTLTACNTDKNNVYDREDVNYRPVRYNEQIDDELDRRENLIERDTENRRLGPIYNRGRRYYVPSPVRDEDRTIERRNSYIPMNRTDDRNRIYYNNFGENNGINRVFQIKKETGNDDAKLRRKIRNGTINGSREPVR